MDNSVNNIDKQYIDLLGEIIETGFLKKDRTNTGTKSIYGKQIRHNMSEGFPLLTSKKLPFKVIITELLWFLRGETNIKTLIEKGCYIWNGDAHKAYLTKNQDGMTITEFINKIKTDDEFSKKWGELGPIYGSGWRNFEGVDQISNLLKDLKDDPDSRRLKVSAWQPHKLKDMVLPPCHTDFQLYTRELTEKEINQLTGYEEKEKPTRAISLLWNQRSCDVPLGLPFNIASYALLLEIIAKSVNMIPETLIGNLGDSHIYLNQIEGVEEQMTRTPFALPKLKFNKPDDFFRRLSEDISLLNELDENDFQVENYQSHKKISIPLSN